MRSEICDLRCFSLSGSSCELVDHLCAEEERSTKPHEITQTRLRLQTSKYCQVRSRWTQHFIESTRRVIHHAFSNPLVPKRHAGPGTARVPACPLATRIPSKSMIVKSLAREDACAPRTSASVGYRWVTKGMTIYPDYADLESGMISNWRSVLSG